MKKNIPTLLALTAVLLIFGFLIWALGRHGAMGLVHVNAYYQRYFIFFTAFGFCLIGLIILERRLRPSVKPKSFRWLSVSIALLALGGIAAPAGFFLYVEGIPSPGIGATEPQILLTEGVNQSGLPNLAVTFNTAAPTKNVLSYGSQTKSGILNEEMATRQHAFMLPDLEPDTRYWFKINDSMKYFFQTPPAPGQPLLFAVGSDAHFGSAKSRLDLTETMLDLISGSQNHYDCFFQLGDLVENGFNDAQWRTAFQLISPTTAIVPTRLVAGNHDTLFGGLRRYEDYCYPEGLELEDGSRLWNRLDFGNVHFLVLDVEWSAESFDTRQAKWLEEQLRSIPANDWKIVMSHGFYYASGSYDNGWQWYDNPETINALTPLFEKYGVDMVFSGHAHQLEMLQKNGVSYVVCGGFGGMPDEGRTYISPASLWYASGRYAFVEVTVNAGEARIIFRDPDNGVIKDFTLAKITR
jgi:UDP-2,3-diacylglucosamine pyrophosphatase LpxH